MLCHQQELALRPTTPSAHKRGGHAAGRSWHPRCRSEAKQVLRLIQQGHTLLPIGFGVRSAQVELAQKYGEDAAKQAGGLKDKKIDFLVSKAEQKAKQQQQHRPVRSKRHRELRHCLREVWLDETQATTTTTTTTRRQKEEDGDDYDSDGLDRQVLGDGDGVDGVIAGPQLVQVLVRMGVCEGIAARAVELIGEGGGLNSALDAALALGTSEQSANSAPNPIAVIVNPAL